MSGAEKAEGSKIRIVYYVPQLHTGGTEVQLFHLVTGLSSRFEASVWCPGPWGPIGERLVAHRVPVHRFPLASRNPHTFVAAVQHLRRLKPLIFHSFGYGAHWLDIVAARLAGIPLRVTSRRNVRHWKGGDRLNLTERIRNQFTDVVVSNSEEGANRCHHIEGVTFEHIHTIPNGVLLDPVFPATSDLRKSLGIPPEDFVVGNVANLKAVKGHAYLLQAFRKVAKPAGRAWLIICGEGNLRPQLEHLRDSLGLRDRVLFLEDGVDSYDLYQCIDLYVHSSLAEGMPNAVLEAMARGLAVVATRAGGTPEVVLDGTTGLLVKTSDAQDLAVAMLRLIKDDQLRCAMGAAGRRHVASTFEMQRMIRAHELLYSRLSSRLAAAAPRARRVNTPLKHKP